MEELDLEPRTVFFLCLSRGVEMVKFVAWWENQVWEIKKDDSKMSKGLNKGGSENMGSSYWRKVIGFYFKHAEFEMMAEHQINPAWLCLDS